MELGKEINMTKFNFLLYTVMIAVIMISLFSTEILPPDKFI